MNVVDILVIIFILKLFIIMHDDTLLILLLYIIFADIKAQHHCQSHRVNSDMALAPALKFTPVLEEFCC
jgi:hypothetical protein